MKIYFLFFVSLLGLNFAKAQINGTTASIAGQTGVVTTSVPFLLITPDARSGGMADVGVAISPDANSIYWNPSKLAFAPEDMAFSASYTPWLRDAFPDVTLYNFSGYKTLDNKSTFGFSGRYFELGSLNYSNNNNIPLTNFNAHEYSIEAAYSRRLSSCFSFGISEEFIYSALTPATPTIHPAEIYAFGFSGYYTKKITLAEKPSELAFGINIDNVGQKIIYSTYPGDFIPANLKLGGYLNVKINDENEIALAIDLNKLLVPTPPIYALDSIGAIIYNPDGTPKILKGKNPNVSVLQGMIQSFYDAPNGFSQEIALIDPSIAFEYRYLHKYSARIGYFYEAPDEGDRQYLTLGLGANIFGIVLDVSYLIPTNNVAPYNISPLTNTFRISLSTNINKGKLVKS